MGKIQDAVKALNEQREGTQKLVLVYLVLLVLAGVIGLFQRPAAVLLVIGAILFYLFYYKGEVKRYNGEYIRESINFGICKEFSEVNYDRNEDIKEALQQQGLFCLEQKAPVNVYHGIHGKCRKQQVTLSEVVVQYDQNEKVKSMRDVRTIAGTAVLTPLSEELAALGPAMVYDRYCLTINLRARIAAAGFEEMQAEESVIDSERLAVYLPKDNACEAEVRDTFLHKVAALADHLETPFALSVRDGKMLAIVSGRFYAHDLAIRHEVTEQALGKNYMPELDEVLQFAE